MPWSPGQFSLVNTATIILVKNNSVGYPRPLNLLKKKPPNLTLAVMKWYMAEMNLYKQRVQVAFTEATANHSSWMQLLSGWSSGDSMQVMEFPGDRDMITLYMKPRNCSSAVNKITFVSACKGEFPKWSRSNGSNDITEKYLINTGGLKKEGRRRKFP